jgi:hypothetical protein
MVPLVERPRRLRADDIFFPAMSLVILAVVFIGFGQSYFLAGMVRAKLPNVLVHIHGAVFVAWIFLLVVQNGLVAVRKIRWHIALGVLGCILPPLMVVLGVLTLFDSIRRAGVDIPAGLLLAGDLEELALFAVLIAWAMIVRRTPAAHKRLMILSTLAIIGPAVNRFPFSDAMRLPGTILVVLGLPLLVVAYDVWTLRRVHRTTVIATASIWIEALTLIPVSQLAVWQPLIRWIGHN